MARELHANPDTSQARRPDDPDHAANADERPRLALWQTEPCPSWCTWAPHDDSEHPGDRYHVGSDADEDIDLLLYAAVDYGGPSSHDWSATKLRTYLEQRADAAHPIVRLVSDDIDPRVDLRMRLAEARQLAARLLSAIEKAGER